MQEMISTGRSKQNLMQRNGCTSVASNSNLQEFCLKDVNDSRQENMSTIGCPFKVLSGIDCAWFGSPSEVIDHIRSFHAYETQEKSEPFPVELQNFSKYKNFHKAVLMLDKLFYLLWVIKEDIVHFLIFVIPKRTSEEYAYDFRLQKGQEQFAITGGACGSFLYHESKVLENGDTVRLHCNTVKNFVDDNGNLSCVIEIRRNVATPSSNEVSVASDMEKKLLYSDDGKMAVRNTGRFADKITAARHMPGQYKYQPSQTTRLGSRVKVPRRVKTPHQPTRVKHFRTPIPDFLVKRFEMATKARNAAGKTAFGAGGVVDTCSVSAYKSDLKEEKPIGKCTAKTTASTVRGLARGCAGIATGITTSP
jgi:hypothetical protein